MSPLLTFDGMSNRDDELEPVWLSAASYSKHAKSSSSGFSPSTETSSGLSQPGLYDCHQQLPMMPSWPSSVLIRGEDSSPGEEVDREGDVVVGSASPVSDQATENFLHKHFSPSTKHRVGYMQETPHGFRSPLSLERAVQVDEFGRFVLTVKARAEGTGAAPLTKRHGQYGPSPSPSPSPAMSTTSHPTADASSIDTPRSSCSRDTFGVNQTMKSPEGPLRNDPLYWSGAQDEQHKECQGSLLRFPILLEAIAARSPGTASPSTARGQLSSKALLSPIELDGERARTSLTYSSPHVVERLHWRPCGVSFSSSDGQLHQRIPMERRRGQRFRAATLTTERGRRRRRLNQNLDESGSTLGPGHVPMAVAPYSQDIAPSTIDGVSQISFNTPPSSSPSDGKTTTVKSIIEQQRAAMEKLTRGGFLKPKVVAKRGSREEKLSDARFRLPAVPEEDYLSKVSLWAWRLSSEGDFLSSEQAHVDVVEKVGSVRSSDGSPPEEMDMDVKAHVNPDGSDPNANCAAAAEQSWEWLSHDDAFTYDTFDTCESRADEDDRMTLQESLVLESVQDEEDSEEGLGRRINGSVASDDDDNDDDDSFDSFFPSQRESMTTAAIEALLSQVCHSQITTPSSSTTSSATRPQVMRKVGASYLYQQILDEKKHRY